MPQPSFQHPDGYDHFFGRFLEHVFVLAPVESLQEDDDSDADWDVQDPHDDELDDSDVDMDWWLNDETDEEGSSPDEWLPDELLPEDESDD